MNGRKEKKGKKRKERKEKTRKYRADGLLDSWKSRENSCGLNKKADWFVRYVLVGGSII
jgi:hypothetical protein